MSSDASVFSRFVVKFVEIIAAGLATAVSGYLLAHLTGALSSPVPEPARTVVEDAANPANRASPANPVAAQPPSSVSADGTDQGTAAKQEVTASPPPQVAPLVSTTKAAPQRKRTETATTAAETKHNPESLLARVRAALASVDANRAGPREGPPQTNLRVESGGAAPPASPSADSSRSTVRGAVPPNTVDLGPPPAQQTQPNPLPTVEIQSRPVAAVQPSPTPPADRETGVMSDLEQMLRHDPLAGSEEAPRPPLPVGQ
jgi:hypothetical protein